MKLRSRMTVTLGPEEVRDAIKEYILARIPEAVDKPNDALAVFLVTEDHGRHAGCSVEADWFRDI